MDGEKFSQAQAALKYVLRHLNPEDRFNIIAFSTGLQRFDQGLQPAAAAARAADWVDTLRAEGGTDINRALPDAQEHFVENPAKTIFLLITDLYEGGNGKELVQRMRQLVESKVKAMVLLALSDSGRPSYDHDMAKQLTDLGVYCFGCTPKLLVQVMERVMKGQDIGSFLSQVQAAEAKK